MTTRSFGVLHRQFVLAVLVVMCGLQVVVGGGLILCRRLEVIAVLATVVSA